MQKPLEQTKQRSLLSLLKNNFPIFTDKVGFEIRSQMPGKQISHFAKQAVHNKNPIIVQINDSDSIFEISGVPFISNHSGHLILKDTYSNVTYLIKANTIRHIRKQI